VIEAKMLLDQAETDLSMERHMCTAAKQVSDLLRNTKFSNSDYATVKALARGETNMWVGFDFVRSEQLNFVSASGTDATNRKVLAWVMNCQCLAIGMDTKGRVSERDDKDYSTQIYYAHRVGATRMDETGSVMIECQEVPFT
jgi:predicted DNA binding protein